MNTNLKRERRSVRQLLGRLIAVASIGVVAFTAQTTHALEATPSDYGRDAAIAIDDYDDLIVPAGLSVRFKFKGYGHHGKSKYYSKKRYGHKRPFRGRHHRSYNSYGKPYYYGHKRKYRGSYGYSNRFFGYGKSKSRRFHRRH